MQQKPRNTEQIESRANILKPRIRKLLRAYAESKSELYKSRCNRLLEIWEDEYGELESEYRLARKRDFDFKKDLQKAAKHQPVFLN